jgi:hypothetical protein
MYTITRLTQTNEDLEGALAHLEDSNEIVFMKGYERGYRDGEREAHANIASSGFEPVGADEEEGEYFATGFDQDEQYLIDRLSDFGIYIPADYPPFDEADGSVTYPSQEEE